MATAGNTVTRDAVWQAPRLEALETVEWNDETFVFDPDSGETHLLNPSGAIMLRRLGDHPSTLEDLVRWLHDPDAGIDETQLTQAVQAQLRQMHMMGLVEKSNVFS